MTQYSILICVDPKLSHGWLTDQLETLINNIHNAGFSIVKCVGAHLSNISLRKYPPLGNLSESGITKDTDIQFTDIHNELRNKLIIVVQKP